MSASICCVVATASAAEAQGVPAVGSDRTVTVVPGPEYDAGGFTRKLLGNGWRDVWLTPVEVRVFDMGTYAGGVTLGKKGGGNQTRTLHFMEKGGERDYLFRSVNKYPVGQAMPPAIRGTTLGNIIQDQVSSLFPAAALMIPPLLEANGVLHVKPALYVMPDDPRLGEFRKEFAGLLGTVELSPQEDENDEPGFAGSRKIKSSDGFLKDVEESRAHRLDERELFAVRLVDFLGNDNDRTTDNMRFVRYGKEGAYIWRPLPRDRDRAFSDARGWLIKFVVHPIYPKLIEFGPRYDLAGLTFESHGIDRRLLQRLTRSDAEEVGQRVQKALDDQVIEKVIAALPPEWRARTDAPARLRSTLKARRDRLPEVARAFYAWLATEVDVHGTDQDEHATIERHPDGRLTVTVRGRKDAETAEPFSQRTFLPEETNEVRVYLHGGDDRAIVRGAANDAITARIIGGGGDDVLADSAGGGATRFYDEKGKNRFLAAKGTRVSERDWTVPKQGGGVRFDAPWRPDWGKSSGWGPAFDYVDGGGLVIGFGPRYQSYGFRRLPYKWKTSANVLLATGTGDPGVGMSADYRFENSPSALMLDARATKYEAFRFHGFGNDADRQDRALALVIQDLVAVDPRFVRHIGWRAREDVAPGFTKEEKKDRGLRPLVGKLEAGPLFLWNRAHPADGSPFETETATMQTVGRVGARVGLQLDRTSEGPPSDRGWTLRTELAGYPPFLDLDESFTTTQAVGAVYVPLQVDGPHLAFRAGGASVFGPSPVQHAATIGGRSTVRGYSSRRYTGDRSAFGSAELRVPIGVVPVFIKWKTGAFALADVGRVWLDGESPGGWHSGIGGGIWFSSLGQTFSVAYAHGEQHRIYLQRGMAF
ncbi:MAG: ShlB/FhaC/HecB family hemolysin secretion/activation protein [Gemmatimonadales bacterium]